MRDKFVAFLVLVLITESLSSVITSKPLVIAHRGASGYLPEHTLESKTAAFFMQADYIEQDVILTKDNHPIVLHDLYLDEVTDVASKYPEKMRADLRFYAIDLTLEEIKTLKVFERFRRQDPIVAYYPQRFPLGKSNFQISTLKEEIEMLQGLEGTFKRVYALDSSVGSNYFNSHNIGLYVEIKNPKFHIDEGKANFSEIVLNLLDQYGYTDKKSKIYLQCFDPKELRRIREELKCNLSLVQLLSADQTSDGIEWTTRNGLEEIKKFADGIGPEKSQLINFDEKAKILTPSELYQNAKELGLFIHAYTFRIDDLPTFASCWNQLLNIFLNEIKIEGLFTDFPDLTLKYLNSQNT
ncbi:glycerophosphoryl diester phosphodiesterase, partial [Brachionus plicatilis]